MISIKAEQNTLAGGNSLIIGIALQIRIDVRRSFIDKRSK